MDAKESVRKQVQDRLARIAHERAIRYKDICEEKRQESVLTCEYADKERRRDGKLKQKADQRKKTALAEIREIIKRHGVEAQEQQARVDAARKAKQEQKLKGRHEIE